MEDEYRISEKDDGKFIRYFGVVFLAFFSYLFVATDFEWIFLIFLTAGVLYFPYHLRKVKEVYFKDDCLAIKTRAGFAEIPLDSVSKVKRWSHVQGCREIVFKEPTQFGWHIAIAPRKEGSFRKHENFKRFMKAVNAST